ncbi:hydantoinase/oxoprolinase-like protein [Streptomyces sp. TLI_235]|nr:hypothetical protein [Streptomyces sp. TLI_235]PBC69632.1 hydantoinase/oxoprolinase-like protein [Streptomyces sp. TLI_235]
MRIGIRLNTDEVHTVLTDGRRVVETSSAPPTEAWDNTLAALIRRPAGSPDSTIDSVTWDISGLLEASLLPPPYSPKAVSVPGAGRVAALRIVPRALHGRAAHPSSLVTSLAAWRATATGGHDLFGTELAPLDLDGARECARSAQAQGLTTLAVTATGAGACADHEQAVAALLLEEFPHLRLCLSHESGGLGLLEREATTVINAALLDVVADLVDRCEQATSNILPNASCWFACSDGGRVPAKRMRWLPVTGLAATTPTALMGAAALAGRTAALVALVGSRAIIVGRVEGGLPHIETNLPGSLAVQLTLPQAAATVHPVGATAPGTSLIEQNPQAIDVVAVLDEGAVLPAHQLMQAAGRDTTLVRSEADLAGLGTACTEPSAWLDLLVPVSAAEELDRVQSEIEQRALTLVATDGPGSECIVRSVASPVGYLSIYRLQVRAAARARTGDDR